MGSSETDSFRPADLDSGDLIAEDQRLRNSKSMEELKMQFFTELDQLEVQTESEPNLEQDPVVIEVSTVLESLLYRLKHPGPKNSLETIFLRKNVDSDSSIGARNQVVTALAKILGVNSEISGSVRMYSDLGRLFDTKIPGVFFGFDDGKKVAVTDVFLQIDYAATKKTEKEKIGRYRVIIEMEAYDRDGREVIDSDLCEEIIVNAKNEDDAEEKAVKVFDMRVDERRRPNGFHEVEMID